MTMSADASEEAGREPAGQPSVMDLIKSTLRELPGLISDRVDLLSLELHRAGLALAQMVALGLAAGIFAGTAWLALWAGVVLLLIDLGVNQFISVLIVLVINAVAVWLALLRLARLAPLLQLPATRRHLTVAKTPPIPQPPPTPEPAPKFHPSGGSSVLP